MPQVSLDQMIAALREGAALVSFPTDTVPALATKPEDAELIYAAKQRSPDKPLILMGATLSDLLPYVTGSAADLTEWKALAERYWPGQLTLVLPASDRTPPQLNPMRTGTLGIRVPNHPLAIALLARSGPLATTSANLSGQSPLIQPAAIARQFPTALTLLPNVIDSYPSPPVSGQPSTVAQWTNSSWQILRQGAVDLSR